MLRHLSLLLALLLPATSFGETKVGAGTLRLKHQSAPGDSTPTGYVDIYCKSSNECYKRDSASTEVQLGAGSVTSVGLEDGTISGLFAITGSPVTSSGNISLSFAGQSAHKFLGSATSGSTVPQFRILDGSDLPDPGASSKGGVKSKAAETNKFLTQIGTDGSVSNARPACGDLSDAAASCSTLPSIGSFGSAPDAKGATASGTVITMQPADATHPGALSTASQDIAGEKRFMDGMGFKEVSTPSNPSSGYWKFYPKSDGKFYKLSSGGSESEVGGGGSGAGAFNLLILDTAANSYAQTQTNNYNFEASAGGWAAYADSAATAPADMTGGSPNTTCAQNTSSPIDGTGDLLMTVSSGASRQGEGCSLLVNIPPAYRGVGLQATIPFTTSGTLVEGDIVPAAYDVTNSKLISVYISGKILGANGMMQFQFQTDTNTAQIRVGWHIARSSTGALTMRADDAMLSPAVVPKGLAGSNWIAYTPTFTGFGTVSGVAMWWRRVGDSVEIEGTFTTGTVTGSEARMSLPNGAVSDSAKVPAIRSTGLHLDGGTTTTHAGTLFIESGVSYLTFGNQASFTGTSFDASSKATGSNFSNAQSVWITGVKVPISGLDANVTNADSSTYWISSYLANGTRVTSVPTKLGEYRSRYRASSSNYALTDVAPTAPPTVADGMLIYGNVAYGSSGTSGQIAVYDIFVGKNKNVFLQWYLNSGRTGFVDAHYWVNASQISGAMWNYDPTTGIMTVDASYVDTTVTRYLGFTGVGSPSTVNSGYFDIKVSENALAVQTQQPRSEVWVHTANGYGGGASNKIFRYAVVQKSVGTGVTYTDDATNGAYFTINEDGVYSMVACRSSGGDEGWGITVDDPNLTSAPGSVTRANMLQGIRTASANLGICIPLPGVNLVRGNVIRVHGDSSAAGTAVQREDSFRITKVSN